MAWNNFVFSSPNCISLWVNLCLQYSLCIVSKFLMWVLITTLNLNSWGNKGLISSNLSKKAIVILQLAMRQLRLEILLAQSFRTLLRILNLALITWALFITWTGESQALKICSKQLGWWN
jgi:hypothetical protein